MLTGGRRRRCDDDRGGPRDDARRSTTATRLRPHPGQGASASNLRLLLAGSPILASHRDSEHLVQDAYSLRCAPQVHGATRDVLAFAQSVLETELNAVSDNPIVLPDDGDVVSGRSFHGQPVAVAMDALAAATVRAREHQRASALPAARSSLSNGLPPFLVPSAAEQRVHARPVHGGVARLGVEIARASGVRRLDPVVGRAGGPRVDGDDRREARARDRRERGDGRGAGNSARRKRWISARRWSRRRPPVRRSQRCAPPCRSTRRTGNSVPTSRRPCPWCVRASSPPPPRRYRPARLARPDLLAGDQGGDDGVV